MMTNRKRRKAAERAVPGNGRPLKRFRAWQPLSRALFSLRLADRGGRPLVYTVDVPYWQRVVTENGQGKAHLYLNGAHHAESALPGAFRVPGGVIEVEPTSFGLRRCHYVTDAGAERRLDPDPRSAEGRRARLAREYPVLSRLIGAVALTVLSVSLGLLLLQFAEGISRVPPVAERFGTFASPVALSLWQNAALGLCAAVASVERATRLRFNALLDSGE